jgi:hypothetical protein
VTRFAITHEDRAAWQRRAAAELVAILHTHPNLPIITWTVGNAGSVLVGLSNGLRPATEVRQVFTAWQEALWLTRTEVSGGGSACLRAANDRDGVRIRLMATIAGEHTDRGGVSR